MFENIFYIYFPFVKCACSNVMENYDVGVFKCKYFNPKHGSLC